MSRPLVILFIVITAALGSTGCPRPETNPDAPRLSWSVGGELRPDSGPEPIFGAGTGTAGLADLTPFFKSRDLVMADLAGGFDPGCVPLGPNIHRWAPAGLDDLARANIKVISLADDHALDCGRPALAAAMEAMLARGFYLVGAGRGQAEAGSPVYLTRNDVTVSLVAFYLNGVPGEGPCDECPGPARYDSHALNQALAAMSRRSQHQVVVLHFKERELPVLNESELGAAREAIDFGADLVIGYGPATAGGLHRVRGRWLIASMGRMSGPGSEAAGKICDGLVLSAEFSPDRIAGLRLSPLEIQDGSARFVRGEPGGLILTRLLQSSTTEVQDNSKLISDILYLK